MPRPSNSRTTTKTGTKASQKTETSRQRGTTTMDAPAGRSTAHSNGIPSRDEIERRAYEIFQARGGSGGADIDDWLQAERELRAERQSSD